MSEAGQSQGAREGGPAHRYTAAYANELETRWQDSWAREGVYRQANPGEPGFDARKPKFYCLDMFPYPSGAGLHVGHPEGYTATDIISRFKRMRGFNVLHPMGWDAFGLPAEQYAIQTGVHPAITTKKSIETFKRQLSRFGFSYDWSREFGTIDPGYYKWTQWIFLKLYDAWVEEAARQRGSEAAREGQDGGRARPISELVAKLERGEIAAQINPRAEEAEAISPAPASWGACTPAQKRSIIDSYRLAYIGETTVNWCPKLGTVLANDEVIDGRSERGGYPVLRKPLKQWMFRITSYAERLLSQLDGLDWPESTRTMQREWIGKSEGAEIRFQIACGKHTGEDGPSLTVFTTRPDTLFGATYMVVAPEHPLVDQIMRAPADRTNAAALKAYVDAARKRSDVERMESKQKTGVDLGVDAINPANGKTIPIWVADYVLMGYGTGAIMAVPSGDERDFEFAKKFGLSIVRVVEPDGGKALEAEECFSGEGVAVNSQGAEVSLDGLPTREAKKAIIAWLERTGRGKRHVNYKLRDWTFSRQRYWGEPIPIVFDDAGNHYPVSDAALPVRLPELADYAPIESEDPKPLLAKATAWARTTAGEAGVDPKLLAPGTSVSRETNTMPGSAGSSWYFLRYCDARNDRAFASREALEYWMGGGGGKAGASVEGVGTGGRPVPGAGEDPARRAGPPGGGPQGAGVDLYLGGSEHAVGHLLYARFWNSVLFDLGHVPTAEPFQKLFHQGLITSFAYQRADKTLVPSDEVEDKGEGVFVEKTTGAKLTPIVAKMSKSLKNVVNPDDVIAEFGADTFRLYEMYMGPLDASKPWNPRDITGCYRFLQRAWRVCVDENTGAARFAPAADEKLERALHRLIKKVEGDVERLAFNTAIAAMIEFVNACVGAGEKAALTKDQVERFALVLCPFVPHVAEEIWTRCGRSGSITREAWPAHDPKMLVDSEVEIPVSIMGKVRSKVMAPTGMDSKSLEALALAEPRIAELLAGKAIKKVIVVPGKMVNIVHG